MTDPRDSWHDLLARARHVVDARSFQRLAREMRKLDASAAPDSHVPLRVAVLGGASVDLLIRPLELALRCVGIAPEIHEAPYNVFLQELLIPESDTRRFEPNVTLLFLTAHSLSHFPPAGADVEAAERAAAQASATLYEAASAFHRGTDSELIVNTIWSLPPTPSGNFGASSPDDANNFIRRVNTRLGDEAPAFVHLNDLAALAERRGLDQWVDARLWHEAKQFVAPSHIPEVVHNTASIVGALVGRTKKCLVLDLDNTLWGGVIGDDGVEGIEVGEGTGRGEAHKALQQYAKGLKERGILLAVCSKNDEKQALKPFDQHPEMVLRRDDFVAFKANWEPKSMNLRAIAQELNIGLDALVFLDDNPAEREEVRQGAPEVLVPELTDDPTDYVRILHDARAFEVVGVTSEDRARSEMYRGRAQRAELEASATDLSSFLESLEMTGVVRPFEPLSLPRVAQLINKTNQFNLTTRRRTPAEVEEVARSHEHITRTVRLADKFGDHGLISVVIGEVVGEALELDTWLMSCRVLKRGVERMVLNEVVAAARERGLKTIRGTYIPTDRNGLVRDHYRELGFDPGDGSSEPEAEEGDTRWHLDLATFEPLDNFISVQGGET